MAKKIFGKNFPCGSKHWQKAIRYHTQGKVVSVGKAGRATLVTSYYGSGSHDTNERASEC